MGAPISHLNNINDLHALNELLHSKGLEEATSGVSWGSRIFTLKYNDQDYHVKMKDIVAKFQELAPNDANMNLIGNIHDRIVALDFEGKIKLNEQNLGSEILRDFKNISTKSSSSHLENTNQVLKSFIAENRNIENIQNQLLRLVKGEQRKEDRTPKSLIENGFDEDTKNAIRLIVMKHPDAALKILNLFNAAAKELEPQMADIDLGSIQAFLKTMQANVKAHPDMREATLKTLMELPKIIQLFESTAPDQFREKFMGLNINHKYALTLFAEKDPQQAYPIIKALARGKENEPNLVAYCQNLSQKIEGKVPPYFKTKESFFDTITEVPLYPLKKQQELHNQAKKELTSELKKLNATVEFVKAPKNANLELKKGSALAPLNQNVFTCAITRGIKQDIIDDGNRKEDTIILIGVPSQMNGREQVDRNGYPSKQIIQGYRDDGTFGPECQLAFGSQQVTAIYEAGEYLNILSPILSEKTKTAVINGYLTPTSENIDELIKLLETHGHLIEYPCIGNTPIKGEKNVYQILGSAVALGRYNLDPNIDPAKVEKIQYLCAIHFYRGQFQKALDFAKSTGKDVVLKTTGVGVGAFGNDPDVIARAYHDAALEYRDRLAAKGVKVVFQLYEKKNSTAEDNAKDGAHIMKEKLGLI
jgi:hypothetical protein